MQKFLLEVEPVGIKTCIFTSLGIKKYTYLELHTVGVRHFEKNSCLISS